ncbi:MAG: TonB-dependent copper receptor [Rudaea sp.]|nr:TonB-dependent copper receptor [Rudaea sp.]
MSVFACRGRDRACSPRVAAALFRPRPLPACVLAALLLAPSVVRAADEIELFDPIVVTAPMQTSPLTVVTDPKAPRQPVPASDGADFLKSIPGFSSIRKGGSNGDPVLRGMTGSRLNILIDGGQIGGGCPSRMDPPTAYISPQLFDRVTIIKGPQTVLYGPGNSAGTILFEREVTRYTAPTLNFTGSLLGGSWGRNDQMAELRAGNADGYGEIAANHTHSQDYEDGDGRRVHSSYDRWNADGALGWTPDDDTRLELSAGKGNGRAAYAFSGMDGAQFLRESAGLTFERRHISAVFEKFEVKAYYNYADHVMDNYTLRQPDPNSMMPMPMAADVDRKTVGGRVAGTFAWGDALQLTTGLDASSNVHTARSGGAPGTAADYHNQPRLRDVRIADAGAFAELRWTFAERQRLITGLRYDHAQARGYGLTTLPGGGMGMMDMGIADAHDLSRASNLRAGFARYERDLTGAPLTLYAGLGHTERFPDYWELFGQHTSKTIGAFTGLRPEKTTQIDVGLQYDDQRLKAWVSAYAGVVDDFIVLRYGSGMMATDHAANVDARTAGGEAGVAYTLNERWKADATLAYAWGENRTERRPLPQMPPLETRLGLTYDDGRWSAGGLWRIAAKQRRVAIGEGNIVGQDLGPTGGFGVFSVNAGWRIDRRFTVSAGIDNLLNKTYAEHVNAATVELAGYVNTVRVNEPGRTAWLKLDMKY